MSRALLSLGSNLAPEANLASAVRALRERFGHVVLSPVYRTTSVGFEGGDFLNAGALIETSMTPQQLNHWLHALEDLHARDRSGPRFGDRTLDIDIVLFDDLVLDGPGHLQIPRDDLRHAFVLRPLVDIAPEYIEPRSGASLAGLWARSAEREVAMTVVAQFDLD